MYDLSIDNVWTETTVKLKSNYRFHGNTATGKWLYFIIIYYISKMCWSKAKWTSSLSHRK